MKKLDSIWRWAIMGGLISLMFVNLSCSDDSIDYEECTYQEYKYVFYEGVNGCDLGDTFDPRTDMHLIERIVYTGNSKTELCSEDYKNGRIMTGASIHDVCSYVVYVKQ